MRIGGRACNRTGKLSAFQTSLYADRAHAHLPSFSFYQTINSFRRSVTFYLLVSIYQKPYPPPTYPTFCPLYSSLFFFSIRSCDKLFLPNCNTTFSLFIYYCTTRVIAAEALAYTGPVICAFYFLLIIIYNVTKVNQ